MFFSCICTLLSYCEDRHANFLNLQNRKAIKTFYVRVACIFIPFMADRSLCDLIALQRQSFIVLDSARAAEYMVVVDGRSYYKTTLRFKFFRFYFRINVIITIVIITIATIVSCISGDSDNVETNIYNFFFIICFHLFCPKQAVAIENSKNKK